MKKRTTWLAKLDPSSGRFFLRANVDIDDLIGMDDPDDPALWRDGRPWSLSESLKEEIISQADRKKRAGRRRMARA